jgi:hypothetical protein
MANTISKRTINVTVIGKHAIMGWHDLFPDMGRTTLKVHRSRTLAKAEWHILQHDTNFEGIDFQAGSMFKFWETQNFGWVAFHPASKTPEGSTPGRFLFKY